MKKITLLLLLFVTFINTSHAQSPLCASTATSFGYEYVESVTINGVVTTRSGVTFNSGPGYNDYTGSVLTNMVAGNTYPVSVVVKTNSTYQEFVKIWFDFNGNGDLNDAGELIFDQNNTFNGTLNYTGNITVPATAFNGNVYLRVVMVYSSSPTLCGNYSFGNTMDFKVNVTGGVTPATLNVSANNLGGTGSIVSSPAGINTGTGLNSANYSLNSSVTLTATPNGTYKFIGWTGDATGTTNPLTVTMDASKNIAANFGPSNSAPTISAISNISTCPGTVSVGPTSFTIGDVETAATSLVVTATSSNQTLVPNANIALGGSDTNRTITIAPAVGQQGTSTITVKVDDANGGSTSTTYNIVVQDLISPTVVTKNIAVGLDSAGLATIIPAQINNGSTDNCGISSMSVAPNSFTCANIGANTVVLSVLDTKGNVATGTATVTVTDNVNPTITPPANVNVTTNTACTATGVALGTPVTADNCSVASVTNNHPSTTYPLGATTVTWTVTDSSGRTATATQLVTVTDNVNPTITAPADVAGNVNNSCVATTIVLGTPVTADNCSVASVTNNAPATFPLGDTTVTWTVTDGSGNTATATQLVSVGDVIYPIVKTKNATIYLNNLGQAIVTPAMIDNGSTDNCTFSLLVSPNNFVCGNVGINNVILIATDDSGNQTIRPAFVTVVDNLPPTITAPSAVSAIANASCGATGVVLGTPITADNCFIDTPAVNNAPATFPLGATTVTWTVTDRSGNSSTATQIVTVLDTQNPTIATLSAIFVNADAGVCTYASSQLTKPSATDNCSVTVVASPTSLALGSNLVTWTATDGSGNMATSTQTVTVVDNQKPYVATSGIMVALDSSGQATITAAMINSGSTDNCGIGSYSLDKNSFNCSNLGDVEVILTVTDVNGNSATNTSIVTVVDLQNPTIVTLDPISVNADSGVCSYASSQLLKPTAADNCSVASVVASPASLVLGSNIVTWTATDGSGNTETSTQTVTVLDTQNPTIATPSAININADPGVCTYLSSQLTKPTATDNCSVASIVASPASLILGENTVTWTVTDGSGLTATSTQTVTVLDSQKPTIETLAAISVNADSGVCNYASSQLTAPAALDNCSVATVVASPESLNLGANNVTWTVTDGSGNIETSIQNVTVIDTQKPTVETLTDISVNADSGVCTYASSQLTKPTAEDNCSVATVIASPISLVLGSNTVTWTATDGSGNTETSTQTVTVLDTQNPTIATPSAINVNADAGVCTYASSQLTAPTTADNCVVASVVASPTSLDLGENTVTWTVTDGSGLTATSTQTVTVVDTQKPTLVTLDPISVNADSGVCTYASSQLTAPAALDNCSVATVLASPENLNLGANTVTWIVTDGSGNTETSTQSVTVIDTQKPTIATLDAISVNADAGVCTYASSELTNKPAALDNCSVVSMVASPASLDLGPNTVTWTVTDGSGNTETSTQSVTVIDTQKPTIATLDAISVNADAGVCTYASSELTNKPAALDNCSVVSVVASPASLDLGVNTVTWTVTDGSGNTETSTQSVTVIDTQKPTITPVDVVVSTNASCNATGVDLGTPTTTDNCSVASVTNNHPSTTFPLGDTTVIWTVTDGSGNAATATQTVTVEDTSLPTITAPAAVTGNVNASCGATGVVIGNAVTADNCSVASVTNDAPAIFPLGETIVTWTVTDGSGNTATATQLVTMGDTIFPVVKAKNATVYLNSLGQAIVLPSMIDNGTTDNCAFTLTVSPNNLVCANVGQNNVLLIATDASGNQSFKPATITLVDNLAPVIVAPVSILANANASCSATGIILGTPVATDNCTVDTVTNNAPVTFPIGVTTVTWTATDRSGNTATATQTVTVKDVSFPTVVTKNITIQLDASGNATITAADIDNGSSDNCGISTMALSQDTFTISDIGIKTIILTVTDNSNNTSSATAQVTVDGTLNTTVPKNNAFVIYPIPFDSYINITLPDSYTEEIINIQVYDMIGRAVYNQEHIVDNHNVTIDNLNEYSDGSYYINLLDGNKKVILSKHILKKTKQ
jgi:uncharacterized repeat protein (TIGR02543 family)